MDKKIRSKFIIACIGVGAGLAFAPSVFAGTATLTWNANTEPDLAGYKVYYDTASHTGNCPAGFGANVVTLGKVTTHTFNTLTNGVTYYFQIAAYDTSNNISTCSSQVTKAIPAADTTAPITTASPLGGTYTSAQSVTLTANEAATIYYTTNGTTPTTGSSVYSSAINISSGTTLNYFARDTAGNSEAVKTQVYVISTPDATAPITTASPLGGTYTSAQDIVLTANEAATIYYTTDGSTPTVSSSAYVSPIIMTTATTLKYFARDTAGNSEVVKTQTYNITITVPDVTAPSIPVNLIGSAASPSQITISWGVATDNATVVGYKVYRNGVQIATTTQANYSDVGLSAATTYAYTVAAYDSSNNVSSASSAYNVTTQSQPVVTTTTPTPTAPTTGGGGGTYTVQTPALHVFIKPQDVQAQSITKDVNFTWKNPVHEDIAGTLIVRNETRLPVASNDGTVVFQGNLTSFKDASTQAGKTYFYAIYAYDRAGNYSDPELVTVNAGSGSLVVATPSVVPSQVGSTGTVSSVTGEYAQFGPYVTKKHLKLGSVGTDVKNLQKFLIVGGYFTGDVTGYYGKVTQQAVQKFQEDHDVAQRGQDGYGLVGIKTRATMNEHLKPGATTSTAAQSRDDLIRQQIAILQQKVVELLEMLKTLK